MEKWDFGCGRHPEKGTVTRKKGHLDLEKGTFDPCKVLKLQDDSRLKTKKNNLDKRESRWTTRQQQQSKGALSYLERAAAPVCLSKGGSSPCSRIEADALRVAPVPLRKSGSLLTVSQSRQPDRW